MSTTIGATGDTPATESKALPRLYRVPIPVTEPLPALRVTARRDDATQPDQPMLPLALVSPSGTRLRDLAGTPSGGGPAALARAGADPAGGPSLAPADPCPASADPCLAPADPCPAPADGSAELPPRGTSPGRTGPPALDSARFCTSREVRPEPREWSRQFVSAAIEVAAGARSPGQLLRWTTPEVYASLSRSGGLAARARRTSTDPTPRRVVRSVRVSEPAADVCEVCVVVAEGERFRAVAMRLDGVGDRWRVSAFEMC